mgnify:CR=1 FL=1
MPVLNEAEHVAEIAAGDALIYRRWQRDVVERLAAAGFDLQAMGEIGRFFCGKRKSE